MVVRTYNQYQQPATGKQETAAGTFLHLNLIESDRSHDKARYRLPDNYVTLKPITMFNICQSRRTKAARSLSVGPRLLWKSKGAADVSFRGGGDVGGAL